MRFGIKCYIVADRDFASMLQQLTDFFGGFTQETRLLHLTTPLGPEKLLAECVRGEESISAPYSFTISALSLDAGISLRSLSGQPALLELLTVNSGEPRPFHGYLTATELNGANGGMARYTLTLQPWVAFLARTRDSRVFQNMTVLDILDAIFSCWRGRGKQVPSWRFEIADRSVYLVRSLTTQYQESDLAFAERLMNEEGLFYFFEHQGDAGSPGLGNHHLIVADHNGAFKPATQSPVRYTQPGAVMKEDGIDRWRRELRLQTNSVELLSWDYRSLDARPVCSTAAQQSDTNLVSRDVPGQYAYANRAHGQRIADRQVQMLEARRETFTGAGTVRSLAPGTEFTLSEHAVHDQEDEATRTFVVTRVLHQMHNNLGAELKAQIRERVGEVTQAVQEPFSNRKAAGTGLGERPIYRNRFDAIRASVPYRASRADSDGRPLYPRPSMPGQQSAIVVGPPGSVIHTDRDHRVKVQFHWQRAAGEQFSHSRLSHPYPDGHTGAPGDDSAGAWVRVAAPLAPIAGANWGSHALPRVGQEVLVDFIDGDIDRPVIIGTLYNGAGAPDAQHNKVAHGSGVATGNGPAWFPGEAGAHAHPAGLSGLKSQAMQASQSGAGGYSQLVFDDSPGQARVALQHHAKPHQGTAELNLGHLRQQTDNQRLQPVGFGAELKTVNGLALRAGQGLLLSTDGRNGATGSQMDLREAHQQITASHEVQAALASAAEKHNAELLAADGKSAGGADKLLAIAEMGNRAAVVSSIGSASGDVSGGAGGADSFGEPHLQLSSPAGIAVTTPASAIFSTGATSSISAGQDIILALKGNSLNAVVSGVSLFTYGKASNTGKPNQEAGIALHAASGKLSTQSQSAEMRITADKAVVVTSIQKQVAVSANDHVLLTAQGAALKIEGGNITIQAPGKVEFKATMKELAGPADGSRGAPVLPKARQIYNEAFVVMNDETKEPIPHVRYRLVSTGGVVIEGVTDALGRTERIFTSRSETLTLHLPKED